MHDQYFILNSEIYTQYNDSSALFYNVQTGENVVVTFIDTSFEIIKTLCNKQCLYVKGNSAYSDGVTKLLDELCNRMFGCYMAHDYFEKKPFLSKTKLKIMGAFSGKYVEVKSDWLNVLDYLTEISIYLNSYEINNSKMVPYLYKQVISPSSLESNNQLDIDLLLNFLRNLAHRPINVNFLGGSLFEYNNYDMLCDFLLNDNYQFWAIFHIMASEQAFYKNLNTFFKKIKIVLHYIISDDYSIVPMIMNARIVFIVQDETDLKEVEKFVSNNNVNDYVIKPVYNMHNADFFRNNVFITEEDILSEIHDWRNIHRNLSVNDNYFGKLFILNDGKVFDDINGRGIGCIKENNIKHLVVKALNNKSSWFKTRTKIDKCNKCLYKYLCPPLSNYETVLGISNMCHVKA